jgi:hypothetical protein
MTDTNPVLVPAQGEEPQIVKLGTVAAGNIAMALNLGREHVSTIERAISDEINAMSSHFTLAFADIRDQYEVELAKVKSAFTFVAANKLAVIGASVALFVAGAVVGHLA